MMSGGHPGGGLPPPPAYPGYSQHHSPNPNAGGSSPMMSGFPRSHPMMSTPPHSGASMGMHSSAMTHPHQPVYSEQDEKNRIRFQIELEFVQCLGNPNYLHFLAQRGYFKDSSFINYLKYLLYWKDAKYVKFIKYPVCLHFLELLQHEAFRKEIVNGQCIKFLDDQVILSWQHYTRKRVKLIESAASGNQQHTNQDIPNSNAGQNATSAQGAANAATSNKA